MPHQDTRSPKYNPETSSILIDRAVYSLDALLRTCYWYTDRVYLRVSCPNDKLFEVTFKPKPSGADVQLVLSDFMNELLENELRVRIARETAGVRERLVAKAFGTP